MAEEIGVMTETKLDMFRFAAIIHAVRDYVHIDDIQWLIESWTEGRAAVYVINSTGEKEENNV